MVLKSSNRTSLRTKAKQPKQKSTKPNQPKQKSMKTTMTRGKVGGQNISKKGLDTTKILVESKTVLPEMLKTTRPDNEVVTYGEIDFQLREVTYTGRQIIVGPPSLTRFERARITGARSLQLSLGAPVLIKILPDIKDSVTLASMELDARALPISIRRLLPNGLYQDIPADWLK